ncbi:MAG: hypothetical protein JWP65_1989 [Ramlibacter sp.]|jgi:hypothetical protein|uniref:hypothetical protein n=1 Tax=Ramlibacter sp. TaxID=1917967 RepID=UPI0026123AE6|nr:hypothetical protein [Ramlibacter sp.]MDB5751568.1 hypothetical protein [Ramlibacter sp.]
MSTPAARVLIADEHDAIEVFRQALTTTFVLVSATSLAQAQRALQEPTALVVCGCHFSDGGMYDLLRHMKASPQLADIPFVAVRLLEGELDDTLYESVKIAVRALGGNAFVDVLRWQRKYGKLEAAHRLTQLVTRLSQAPNDSAA